MSLDLFKILSPAMLPKGGAQEVGNKAWNLMRMSAAGLSVPAAFVLPTTWCQRILGTPEDEALEPALSSGIAALESATGLGFGSARHPLLVSVRSGAAVSMPGMLETVLNVGMNAETVEGLIGHTGNPRLAWDCYRRLVQNYAEVVEGLPRDAFDDLVTQALSKADVKTEHDLGYAALRGLTDDFLECFRDLAGKPFPDDPWQQLRRATAAVFRSWNAPKAAAYRTANGIGNGGGTAVIIQRMVFGNAGGQSGAGVAFTRDPATGAHELYLDFEFNAQGEDIVAGRLVTSGEQRLRRALPSVWAQLEHAGRTLESLFKDAQDFEFTLQSGTLYLLQARVAKCTSWAALRIAVDQVDEGLITPAEALSRLAAINLDSVTRTRLASSSSEPLASARIAGPGIAVGAVALDSAAATRMAQTGQSVILVRHEMDTADIDGILSTAGILSAAGGRTSHASVVARQLNKVCLVGCPGLEIDLSRRCCRIGGKIIPEGGFLSLDGNDGSIYAGKLAVVIDRPERELSKIVDWQASRSSSQDQNTVLATA